MERRRGERRATKMIPEPRHTSHENINKCNLPTIETKKLDKTLMKIDKPDLVLKLRSHKVKEKCRYKKVVIFTEDYKSHISVVTF